MDIRKLFSELLGTFCLVFAGTAAIVINESAGGVIGHVGICLTFALTLLAMIYAVGDVSGCHINPAVTIGFVVAGRFPIKSALQYIAAQVIGAFLATLLLRTLFPDNELLGATIPVGPAWRSFGLEIITTAIFLFVILAVATGPKEKGLMAGIAIGATLALNAFFSGPISGGSLNPARSLAPAVVSGHMESLWVYLTAPFIGAVIGGICHMAIRGVPPPVPPPSSAA